MSGRQARCEISAWPSQRSRSVGQTEEGGGADHDYTDSARRAAMRE